MTAATGLPAFHGENLQNTQRGREQIAPDSLWPDIPHCEVAERVTAKPDFLRSHRASRGDEEQGIRSRSQVVPPLNRPPPYWPQAGQTKMALRSRASKAVTTNHIILLIRPRHPCGQVLSGKAKVASRRSSCWKHLPGNRTWRG